MHDLPRPDVILTHESDLDGFVAGHLLKDLARRLFDAEIRLEAWNTQAWKQRPLKEKSAWVTDFSFEPRLDQTSWVVVDHHPTETKPQRARLVHRSERCAAHLCYELCREHGLSSPDLDRLVELTDIGDLFREEHPEFDLAQDYASLVKTYSFWNLSRLLEGRIERLIDHPLLEVIRVKRRVEDPLGFAWSQPRVVELSPAVGCVEVVVGNANLIVHQLLAAPECRHATLLTLHRKANSGMVVSLRSRNGEALPLAQKLQGGGHPNAAGATLPRSVQSVPDAVDYLKRVLNPVPAVLPPARGPLGGLTLG